MLFSYGSQVTITDGFYSGQTGVVVNYSEAEGFFYLVRLDVAPADITGLLPEAILEVS